MGAAVEHDGRVVGDVFLRASKHDSDALELGYHFESTSWCKGFATEACRAVIGTVPNCRVQAPIMAHNNRSRRVATKLGFSIIGEVMRGDRLHDLWECPAAPVTLSDLAK